MKILAVIFSFLLGASSQNTIDAGPLKISPESKQLIVDYEVGGGEAYYNKALSRPSWPGGDSGTTIGVGYDLGYNTRSQFLSDWSQLPEVEKNSLLTAVGSKGQVAKIKTKALRWIIVPWDKAEYVFNTKTMPRFGKMTNDAFPGITNTPPGVQGGMLSIVFNRGTLMTGDSRREMREIRTNIKTKELTKIPSNIRSMKRLWVGKGLPGLLRRRDAEAALIERALRN